MNIEILRIHEDYVTTIFTFNVTEWLACPGGNKFSKPIEVMTKEELNVFLKNIMHFCEEQRWCNVFAKADSEAPEPLNRTFNLVGRVYIK